MNIDLIDTTVTSAKTVMGYNFYVLRGTEEDGEVPTVRAVDLAKKLGYVDPTKQVDKILNRNKELFEGCSFLVDFDEYVNPQSGGSHKAKTRAFARPIKML